MNTLEKEAEEYANMNYAQRNEYLGQNYASKHVQIEKIKSQIDVLLDDDLEPTKWYSKLFYYFCFYYIIKNKIEKLYQQLKEL